MRITSPALRWTVAVALALTAVTTVVSVLLMPDFSGGHEERLLAIAASSGTATASALLFTFSQLFLAVGVVGVAVQLAAGAPRLAYLAAAATVLGAFGHSSYGGVQAVMLAMAADPGDAASHAEVLARAEAGAGLPLMALGLLGTVLGLILLGAAVLRAGFGPRWLGIALIAFVVVEFALSGLSVWAGYLSGALFLGAFLALAVLTARGAQIVGRPARARSVSAAGAA
ncbi:hypothetical protein KZX45_12470 [Georgenia sp. EYE_87]|uniref:hypothetical protein n=1 Tax=Georgenia sp. EYE_87 TaxID=2853448 RepID=UPI0020030048|nr:hypothetical protein [Georgenia sp. EYE_87]MCK6211357.1 hypothetical protein [Georgenia sp. EYE_87]